MYFGVLYKGDGKEGVYFWCVSPKLDRTKALWLQCREESCPPDRFEHVFVSVYSIRGGKEGVYFGVLVQHSIEHSSVAAVP